MGVEWRVPKALVACKCCTPIMLASHPSPFPSLMTAETNMQQPTTNNRPIILKQFKVPTHKEDLVTTPFIFNKWVSSPDTTWVTPVNIFYTRVFGGALVAEQEFMAKMEDIRWARRVGWGGWMDCITMHAMRVLETPHMPHAHWFANSMLVQQEVHL